MGRALEDIGSSMLMVIAVSVVIQAHSGLQSANLVVVSQLKDGKNVLKIIFFCLLCFALMNEIWLERSNWIAKSINFSFSGTTFLGHG